MLYCGQLSGAIHKLREYSARDVEEQDLQGRRDHRPVYRRHIEDDARKVCYATLSDLCR